jgi:hypothetical protein
MANIILDATRGQPGYATRNRLIQALTTLDILGQAGNGPTRNALLDVLRNSTPELRLLAGVIPAIAQEDEELEGQELWNNQRAALEARLADTEHLLAQERALRANTVDSGLKLAQIRTLQFLPDAFPPELLLAIDAEEDGNVKRSLLSTLTTKKCITTLLSSIVLEAANVGLPLISEDQLKAIITGDLSKFSLGSLLDQSALAYSLPPMETNSSRYSACMNVLIGYTAMFYPAFSQKLSSFRDKYIAKESSMASWKILSDMEKSYRQVASRRMDGIVRFSDDEYHLLQERFSQKLSLSYTEANLHVPGNRILPGGKGKEKATDQPKPSGRRCSYWNGASPDEPLKNKCFFGDGCILKHECSIKQCRGKRATHRASSCPDKPSGNEDGPNKRAKTGGNKE